MSAIVDHDAVLKRRAQIAALEAFMKTQMPPEELAQPDLRHHFASGVYVRELRMPAGTLAIGKIHKTEHFALLMKGKMTVTTERGAETFEAPLIMVAAPGTKRVAYAHDEVIFCNVHAVGDERDIEAIEQRLVCEEFDELEAQAAVQAIAREDA